MDNQQIPKADSKFQKIARKNHRKWKLRLLSKGGQKADSGGSPYNKKPDYNRAKSAPPGFGGSLEESEQLDEVIRKKGDKYCLFSKKTKRNLGCYPTRAGAMKREKQVQYFKHLKEEIMKALIEVLEEGKSKGKDDRCVRIAKSKYDAWPSAYASGAVVKCRQGKIWKNIKEEEELDEEKKLKRKLKKGIASALSAMTAVLPPPDAIQSAKGKKPSEIIKKDKEELEEEWSDKYKRSIDCKNPKGFSQRAHCQGRKKNEGRDPKQGTGKKPKGSGRRLYTDENPKDTVSVKFSTAEDIRDTLSKESFKSKSHARQSQIINLIHQRVRAAHENAKDPETKARLGIALDYAEKRKEASKKKTASLQKEEVLTEKCWPGYTQKGMKTMFGKKYPNCVKKTNEETELEERKLGKPSSETSLRDWFKRKGAPGKRGGWVDCNTCRNGKCSPCGRQGGEKRSKYPRCRPTPAQCKGYKRRGSNLKEFHIISEEVFGSQAFAYHGSRLEPDKMLPILLNDEFSPGSGDGYGKGLYAVYNLKNSTTERGTYGSYIYKLKINLDGFISFNPDITKLIYKKEIPPHEQAKILGLPKKDIEKLKNIYSEFLKPRYGFKSFGSFENISENFGVFGGGLITQQPSQISSFGGSGFENINNNTDYSAPVVQKLSSEQATNSFSFLKNKVRGIVFTSQDGDVVVIYDPSIIVPVAWKKLGEDWNKVSKEELKSSGTIRRSIENSFNPERYSSEEKNK